MAGRPEQAQSLRTQAVGSAKPSGGFADLDGEAYYRIAAYDRLAPFLMRLASDTDLWLFVASGGGLTAGRVDASGSLFPYRTSDQLHEAHNHTGPVTLIRIADAVWEPFAATGAEHPAIERNLYKNVLGNRVVFEEIDPDRGLKVAVYRYR